jgi:hypothetical protein
MIYLNCCCAKLIQALKHWITGIYQTFLIFPPDGGAVTEQAFIANPTKAGNIVGAASSLVAILLADFLVVGSQTVQIQYFFDRSIVDLSVMDSMGTESWNRHFPPQLFHRRCWSVLTPIQALHHLIVAGESRMHRYRLRVRRVKVNRS